MPIYTIVLPSLVLLSFWGTYKRLFRKNYVLIITFVYTIFRVIKLILDVRTKTNGVMFTLMLLVGIFPVFQLPFRCGFYLTIFILVVSIARFFVGSMEESRNCSGIPGPVIDYGPGLLFLSWLSCMKGHRRERVHRYQFDLQFSLQREQTRNRQILSNMLPPFVVDCLVDVNIFQKKSPAHRWDNSPQVRICVGIRNAG